MLCGDFHSTHSHVPGILCPTFCSRTKLFVVSCYSRFVMPTLVLCGLQINPLQHMRRTHCPGQPPPSTEGLETHPSNREWSSPMARVFILSHSPSRIHVRSVAEPPTSAYTHVNAHPIPSFHSHLRDEAVSTVNATRPRQFRNIPAIPEDTIRVRSTSTAPTPNSQPPLSCSSPGPTSTVLSSVTVLLSTKYAWHVDRPR